ncbi:hypothetical protein ACWOAH_04980 [Vagococcus vulneris]|uniref:Polysaccharide polymerase n=1 Tax=Vagococcus vulneris TaxID=1977869 RepID=A0A429ZZV3_9ENTE|nr:hypothetical protein [Vagococcus vulneris]RST99571.1 hypothetical protein CBF37_04385 [Vagococcus vulneris]
MTKKISYFRLFIYFFVMFYLLYMPELFQLFGLPIRSQLVVIFIDFVIAFRILFRLSLNRKTYFEWDRNSSFLIFGILLSALYFSFVALINGYNPRILQNLFIIFQLLPILYFLSRLSLFQFKMKDKFTFIFNIILFQCCTNILMLFIPSLKSIALQLYYMGRPENIFISSMRIYGISNDYTFFTPIFHGLMMGIALYLCLFEKSYKFLIYIPFLLITTLLNGRTGLFLGILLMIIVLVFYSSLKIQNQLKSILILAIMVVLLSFTVWIVKIYNNETYLWFMGSIMDFRTYIIYGEKTGNFSILSDMITLPKGIHLLFGSGYRVYREINGISNSDIGFINDLFMGGLMYCSILYGTYFLFIFRYKNSSLASIKKILISTMLITTFVISNFKGEASRGGLIIIGIILCKKLIDDVVDSEETNDKCNHPNI